MSKTTRLLFALLERAVLPVETQQALLERAGGRQPLYAEEFVRLLGDRAGGGPSAADRRRHDARRRRRRSLCGRLRDSTGRDVGVIVSDSFGRAWRHGTTDVAIGSAGLAPLLDLGGRRDSAATSSTRR